ncbi:MAG TPA: DUF4286 domain-containing protein [Dysgonomonas sp.]|nr:DUF4286 domain-containing protein [Dysgonomonas sp.]
MLIFNTTFHIDDSVHDEYLAYLKDTYIPAALAGNLLEQPSLARIESRHEENGVSYALQFKTENIDVLNRWAAETGSSIQQNLADKFGNKVSGFSTLLEEIPL